MDSFFQNNRKRYLINSLLLALAWTVVMSTVLFILIRTEKQLSYDLAMKEAHSTYLSDLHFRSWMANLGGIYIPVTEENQPNPYLSNIPDQNVTTPDGEILTLMNPAWAIRSINEFSSIERKAISHITSLNLLRPQNAGDDWERASMNSFENGAVSTSEIIEVDDVMFLRYMRPMYVEKGCLKCHSYQGYEVGDLRGGISVSLLYSPYQELQDIKIKEIYRISLLIYFPVLFLILYASTIISRRNSQVYQAQSLLLDSNRNLEKEVQRSNRINEQLEDEITRHKQSEKKLSDAFDIINRSSSVVVLWKNDQNRSIEFVSQNIHELLGYSDTEFLHAPGLLFERIHPDDKRLFIESFSGLTKLADSTVIEPLRVLKRDGTEKWLSIRALLRSDGQGEITHIEGIITDLTESILSKKEKETLEAQLSYKTKMDGLGQMAGGIAHDFNNILHSISNAAQLLQMPRKNMDEKSQKYVDMIIKASEKASGLTDKLLTYSRKNKSVLESLDLHKVVDDCMELVNNTINKKIEIILKKEAEHTFIKGDASGLENTLINLIINAAQAISDTGQIRITIRNNYYDVPFHDSFSTELDAGEYCEIEVYDTGCGFPEEELKKIFEPFYTTKAPGEGTGLGLTTVYSIIQNHNGALNVSSVPGEYTSFKIAFRTVDNPLRISEGNKDFIKGAGTILFADDEEANRELVSEILKTLGYDVILASNGKEAVDLYKKNPDSIDIIMLDMIMPVLDGREAFTMLRAINRDCKVIISSGYMKDHNLDEMMDEKLNGYIMKPFLISKLSAVLKSVLESS